MNSDLLDFYPPLCYYRSIRYELIPATEGLRTQVSLERIPP